MNTNNLKIAIVHDYLKEFGGAERVLKTLTEMFPDAPIYTAFCVKNSTAEKEFRGKKIKECYLAPILKIGHLYSPLRFLIPLIWSSFDLSNYDLVIVSSSWYVTRGFKIGPKTKVINYCHTPPRWLYGFETSIGLTKYWPVKIYSKIVGRFIRKYDFKTAQKVDFFIANSENVANRIKTFYGRQSVVIYPPIEVENIVKATKHSTKENYFVIVSRLVGAKGLEQAAIVASKLNIKLKIIGESNGFSDVEKKLKRLSGVNVELMGRLSDKELYEVLGKAKCFIALARDEDFGMTVVEAQSAGTPVIAYNGGGFRETVINGKTGILINDLSEKSIAGAVDLIQKTNWKKVELIKNARRFSKERFKREIVNFVLSIKN